MLFTPHILSGMMFGSFASDYGFAFLLGFFSYFLLELIPHWDPEETNKKSIATIRYIDVGLAAISFLVVIMTKQLDKSYILGGIGAIVPYICFQLAPFFTHHEIVLKLVKFKKRLTYKDKSAWGVLIQLSICIISVSIMFQLIDFPTLDKIRTQIF